MHCNSSSIRNQSVHIPDIQQIATETEQAGPVWTYLEFKINKKVPFLHKYIFSSYHEGLSTYKISTLIPKWFMRYLKLKTDAIWLAESLFQIIKLLTRIFYACIWAKKYQRFVKFHSIVFENIMKKILSCHFRPLCPIPKYFQKSGSVTFEPLSV